MAKGQKRSGREPKKPKADKKPATATGTSVFQRVPPKPAPKTADK